MLTSKCSAGAARHEGLLSHQRHAVLQRSRRVVVRAEASTNGKKTQSVSRSAAWAQTMACVNAELVVPISVMTDSYKASHFLQYPEAKRMVAVRGRNRCLAYDSYEVYGINYLVKQHSSVFQQLSQLAASHAAQGSMSTTRTGPARAVRRLCVAGSLCAGSSAHIRCVSQHTCLWQMLPHPCSCAFPCTFLLWHAVW